MFAGHEAGVLHAVGNHYGNLLVSGGRDSAIKFWDVMSGVCVKTLRHGLCSPSPGLESSLHAPFSLNQRLSQTCTVAVGHAAQAKISWVLVEIFFLMIGTNYDFPC